MSKKRKRKETVDESPCELPQTFRELSKLTNDEVNKLLRQFSLLAKGKRNHKLTTLANYLLIDTNGAGEEDPFLQTLNSVKSLTDGWSGDMRKVPEIRLDSILKYLLASHDIAAKEGDFEEYTSNSLKSYKALRSYDLWESGHISGFQFNSLDEVDGFCALKCLANPSGDTSGTQYQVIVIFKDSGEPIGASCTCVAGLGEACTHVAGLMFGVEDFVSRGYKELPDCAATTDKLCKWNVPKGPKVQPQQLKNVSVKKNVPGKVKKEKTFRASDYNPLPVDKRQVHFENLKRLHHELSLAAPNLPWVKAVAPAIVEQIRPKVSNNYSVQAIKSIPEFINDSHPALVPSHVCEVKTNTDPMTLTEKIRIKESVVCSVSADSVAYTTEEKSEIEGMTRGQSSSVYWHKYRLGLITASNFQRVESHYKAIENEKGIKKSSVTENLVQMLVKGNKFKGNSATKYGQAQEPKAVDAYRNKLNITHEGLRILESGLVISNKHHFLGASPDRIIECDCHGRRLLEVKCPYTLVDKSRTIKSMDFLHDDNGLSLKKTGNSYYAQIQGQMGVIGIHHCDLAVWDGKNVEVIPVEFDPNYWNTLVNTLNKFYMKYVFPALLEDAGPCTNKPGTLSLNERRMIQADISTKTGVYHCGKCAKLIQENVTSDHDASINCECPCKCRLWFHWRCVNYLPAPDLLDEEPPWYCWHCVRNCDIVM